MGVSIKTLIVFLILLNMSCVNTESSKSMKELDESIYNLENTVVKLKATLACAKIMDYYKTVDKHKFKTYDEAYLSVSYCSDTIYEVFKEKK